jgi:peptidoglycan DL-endopeptidase LytF
MRGHSTLARYAAPAAFLLAATIAVLIVRAALTNGDEATTPPAVATTAPTTTTNPSNTGTGETTPPADAQFYKIQAGDTLAVVAEQYDTTVEQLMTLNPDVDPVALTIGQRIRVK